MKTIKLKSIIIAAIALICFAGNVVAQRDITSQYITNATLSNGTNGWTKTFTKNQQVTDPADAFSNSVRGNNTIGYASEAYAGWGGLIQTEYSMKQTITLPKGNYRLVCYAFFRQGEAYNTNSSKSLAKLVAGTNEVTLKTLGSITAAGYANSQAEGANCFDSKMYRNVVEFNIAANNTSIEIGVEGTFDEMRSWCIVGMFELFDIDDLASVSSPTDVTYAITNPGFEYRDLTGWTNNITKGNNTYGDNNNFSSKAGIGFYESWQASGSGGLGNAGTFTQTLANMPAGLYELSVYAQNIEQYNGDAGGTGMFVTANSNQTEIGTNGQYKVRTTLQTDGDLTIGIKLENCTGNWIAIDRFGLQFYGDPDAATRELIQNAITEAQGLETTYLTAAQKAALNQAVSDAQTALNNGQNLSTALDNLTNAVSTARQQIQTTKDNRALMLAALERFENDYNLADGTDYSRITMSAETWTTLLTKVNAVSTALDDVEQSGSYVAKKNELIAQLDATDASLRLFKSYKAMVAGCQSLSIAAATTYAANTYMNTDDKENEAISALNSAFVTYRQNQLDEFSAAGFLGSNIDFATVPTTLVNASFTKVFEIPEWKTITSFAGGSTDWTILNQDTDNGDHTTYLKMRANWSDVPVTLSVQKESMLPAGDYQLSFFVKSDGANIATDYNKYRLGATTVSTIDNTSVWVKKTFDLSLTEPTEFDLAFGFVKTATGNSAAEVDVDDITLVCIPGTPFQLAYNAAVAANLNTEATAAAKSAVKEYAAYNNNEDGLLTNGERSDAYWQAVYVLRNAKTIAENSGNATSLVVNGDLSNTTLTNETPAGWTKANEDVSGGKDVWIGNQNGDQVFNYWHETINDIEFKQVISNLPKGAYRLSMDMGTNNIPDGGAAALVNFVIGTSVGASAQVTTTNSGNDRNFDTYISASEVGDSHSATIGLRSPGHYFQIKNIKLEFIGNAATAAAETDASYLRQDFFLSRANNGTEFDFTGDKYTNATGVTLYPSGDNQIIHALSGQLTNTKNVDAGGTCAELVITDGKPLTNTKAFTATSATYTRSMTNSWGTIILPFDLTSNEDVQFYSLKASDAENMTFAQVESVTANTPVAFQKLSGDGITITGSNVGVVATNGSQEDNTTAVGWTAEGSYTAQSIEEYTGIYYIASNKFWAADGTMTVNPFRAIFRYNGSNTVKSFNICIDDTNAIDEIVNSKSEDIKWFDLSGRRVMYPQKNGIYIQNGKKIIIK